MSQASTPDRFTVRIVPPIVAAGLFMTWVDATILSTAIPVMAIDFAIDPVHLKLALTSYLLVIAIFLPASGWLADRLGARNAFAAAMAVFATGSIACAFSQNLGEIVAARVLQGVGGAMMVSVAGSKELMEVSHPASPASSVPARHR